MPFVKLTPQTWPQDDLAVPKGFGGMPPVEFANQHVVGAEFFSLAAEFQLLHTAPAGNVGQTQTTVLPTPQDGDFWCDQISISSWMTFAGQANRNVISYPDGWVTIRDVRTSRPLAFSPLFQTPPAQGFLIPRNSLPIALFRKFLSTDGSLLSSTYAGASPSPSGYRGTGTLIQPFCFTRQGGIELSVTPALSPPGGAGSPNDYTLIVCFGGWKEYAHASS